MNPTINTMHYIKKKSVFKFNSASHILISWTHISFEEGVWSLMKGKGISLILFRSMNQ